MNTAVNQFKNLMQGLYYPAVTGTGIVLVLYRLTQHKSLITLLTDFAFWYGLLFIIFFSACFVSFPIDQNSKYTCFEFILDLIEIALAFVVFFSLGLFDNGSIHPPPNLRGVYVAITFLSIIQTIWRTYRQDSYGLKLVKLRIICFFVGIIGWLWLYRFRWFNVIVLVVLFICAVKYLVIVVLREREKASIG